MTRRRSKKALEIIASIVNKDAYRPPEIRAEGYRLAAKALARTVERLAQEVAVQVRRVGARDEREDRLVAQARAEGRREALEDAAKVAEAYQIDRRAYVLMGPRAVAQAPHDIAARIRALQ